LLQIGNPPIDVNRKIALRIGAIRSPYDGLTATICDAKPEMREAAKDFS
jgi:hypothetical protein